MGPAPVRRAWAVRPVSMRPVSMRPVSAGHDGTGNAHVTPGCSPWCQRQAIMPSFAKCRRPTPFSPHHKVDEREHHDRLVPSPHGVGQPGAQQRREVARAGEQADLQRSVPAFFAHHPGQVQHEVGGQPAADEAGGAALNGVCTAWHALRPCPVPIPPHLPLPRGGEGRGRGRARGGEGGGDGEVPAGNTTDRRSAATAPASMPCEAAPRQHAMRMHHSPIECQALAEFIAQDEGADCKVGGARQEQGFAPVDAPGARRTAGHCNPRHIEVGMKSRAAPRSSVERCFCGGSSPVPWPGPNRLGDADCILGVDACLCRVTKSCRSLQSPEQECGTHTHIPRHRRPSRFRQPPNQLPGEALPTGWNFGLWSGQQIAQLACG